MPVACLQVQELRQQLGVVSQRESTSTPATGTKKDQTGFPVWSFFDSEGKGGRTLGLRRLANMPVACLQVQELRQQLGVVSQSESTSTPATLISWNPYPRTSSIYPYTKFYFFTALRIFHKGIFCGQSRVEDPVDTSSNCNRNFTSFLVISEKVCF